MPTAKPVNFSSEFSRRGGVHSDAARNGGGDENRRTLLFTLAVRVADSGWHRPTPTAEAAEEAD